MNKMIKNLQVILVFSLLLGIFIIPVSITYGADWDAREDALVFLGNVVNLDLTKYEANLDVYDTCYPAHLNGLAQENVVYTLETDGSSIQVAFAFVNNSLYHCGMFVLDGEPIYVNSNSKDVLALVEMTLQNFQAYSKSSEMANNIDYEEMNELLNTIDALKNVELKSNEMKLEMTYAADIDYVAFEWMPTIDNVDFPGITMEFLNGTFCGIGDNWRFHKIGSTNVNISKEEAIKIALNELENFSWNATQDGERVEVTEFNVATETLTAELITTKNREPLTLYPSWDILVYLDDIYPGNVNRFSIGIWADTGEVISCVPLSMGGLMTSDDSASDSANLSINDVGFTNVMLPAIVVVAVLCLTVLIGLLFKKNK